MPNSSIASMFSLPATFGLPLTIHVSIQVLVTVAVAYLLLFRLLGKNLRRSRHRRCCWVWLVVMPVAMAITDEFAKRDGPSPKAFLLITLAGSFFVARKRFHCKKLPGASAVRDHAMVTAPSIVCGLYSRMGLAN